MTTKKRWSPALLASVVMTPSVLQLPILLLTGTWSWDDVWPGVIIIDAVFWVFVCVIWFFTGKWAEIRRSDPGS